MCVGGSPAVRRLNGCRRASGAEGSIDTGMSGSARASRRARSRRAAGKPPRQGQDAVGVLLYIHVSVLIVLDTTADGRRPSKCIGHD